MGEKGEMLPTIVLKGFFLKVMKTRDCLEKSNAKFIYSIDIWNKIETVGKAFFPIKSDFY